MQEDRRSLYPEQMVWLKSVKPVKPKVLVIKSVDLIAFTIGCINWLIYGLLSLKIFSNLVVYLSCILISVLFAGFTYYLFIKADTFILRVTTMGVVFVLGMMTFQIYF